MALIYQCNILKKELTDNIVHRLSRVYWFQIGSTSGNECECYVTALSWFQVFSSVLMMSYPASVLRSHQPSFSQGAAFFPVYGHSISELSLASALISSLQWSQLSLICLERQSKAFSITASLVKASLTCLKETTMLHSSLSFSNIRFAVLNANIQRLERAMEVGCIFISTIVQRLLSWCLFFFPLFFLKVLGQVVFVVQSLSHAQLFWDPMDMGFFQQEYWSDLPFPSPRHLPNPGIRLLSPRLAGGFFTAVPPGKPIRIGENSIKGSYCGVSLSKALGYKSGAQNNWKPTQIQVIFPSIQVSQPLAFLVLIIQCEFY